MIKTTYFLTKRSQGGFTLTELAIVLLLVGLVISAVWVAADKVWDNYRVYRTLQQTTSVVQNIRDYAMNLPNGAWTQVAGTDITAFLDGLNGVNIFPVEMRRTPSAVPPATSFIDHPLNNRMANGSLAVEAQNSAFGVKTAFRIRFKGLTTDPCVRLLTSIPLTDPRLGIVRIGTQNMLNAATNATLTINNGFVTTVTGGVLPMLPSTARNWCNAVNGNEVDLDFLIRN